MSEPLTARRQSIPARGSTETQPYPAELAVFVAEFTRGKPLYRCKTRQFPGIDPDHLAMAAGARANAGEWEKIG